MADPAPALTLFEQHPEWKFLRAYLIDLRTKRVEQLVYNPGSEVQAAAIAGEIRGIDIALGAPARVAAQEARRQVAS